MKSANLAIVLAMFAMAVLVGVIAAGQTGKLRGHRPADLGVRGGMMKLPKAGALNAVSSQSREGATSIAPLMFSGDPAAAFNRLQLVVSSMPRATIITARPGYLHVEFETALLKFVDDAEFVLDPDKGRIEMRSASRLGRRDFGVNRARLEAIRDAFTVRQAGIGGPMV